MDEGSLPGRSQSDMKEVPELIDMMDDADWTYVASDDENLDSDYSDEYEMDRVERDQLCMGEEIEVPEYMCGKNENVSSNTRSKDQPPSLPWIKQFRARNIPTFAGAQGVKIRNVDPEPLNCFLQLFPVQLIQFIVKMTNLNAHRKRTEQSMNSTSDWIDVTEEEMRKFFGLIIGMGYTRLPKLEMYWQDTNWIVDIPIFRTIMSHDRFLDIHRYLHFYDQTTAPRPDDPGRDKLYTIRPLLNRLLTNFEKAYSPKREVFIDEAFIPFKGRISFKKYIPTQLARFGIKVWVLAEVETGYALRMQVYIGENPGSQRDAGLATRVVTALVRPYEGLGHHLYVDKLYTRPELFQTLEKRKIFACGRFRTKEHGFPKEIMLNTVKSDDQDQGEWRMSGTLLAQSWNDTFRPLYFLSTIHEPEYPPDHSGSKTVKLGDGCSSSGFEEVQCPPLLRQYHKFMLGEYK